MYEELKAYYKLTERTYVPYIYKVENTFFNTYDSTAIYWENETGRSGPYSSIKTAIDEYDTCMADATMAIPR